MKDNEFKKSLKLTESISEIQKHQTRNTSTEALYLYTNNSLDEIFNFLRNFYQENPTQAMIESEYVKSSHAENYYYSLMYELSKAYTNFLNINSSIESFEKQFNNICSNYKTNPLEIYKTYDLIVQARENPDRNNQKSLVNSIETEVDEHWEKMKEEKENRSK